jgi:hypothetical protein
MADMTVQLIGGPLDGTEVIVPDECDTALVTALFPTEQTMCGFPVADVRKVLYTRRDWERDRFDFQETRTQQ